MEEQMDVADVPLAGVEPVYTLLKVNKVFKRTGS